VNNRDSNGTASGVADLWNRSVGPFYSTKTVCERMGIAAHDLAGLVKDEKILALPTSDHDCIYPVRQFLDEEFRVLSGWPRTLRSFGDGGIDPWVIATWASTSDPTSLDGMSPWCWLHERKDPEPVVLEAQDFVRRWKQ
jgi:hypothetical protein